MPNTLPPAAPLRRLATFLATAAVAVLASQALATQAAADIRLDVDSDHRLEVGGTGCFDFDVTNNRGNPVNNARIVFMHKQARTTERGRAQMCAKLRWPGVHSFQAFKGEQRDRAEVETTGPGGGLLRTDYWWNVEAQLPAVPFGSGQGRFGACSHHGVFGTDLAVDMDEFGIDEGNCEQVMNQVERTAFLLKVNPTDKTTVAWTAADKTSRVKLRFDYRQDSVAGYLTDRGSGNFYVTEVKGNDAGGCSSYVGGTDPRYAGQPGGPLLVNVTAQKEHFGLIPVPFLTGYTFHIKGAVFGVNCEDDD